MLNVDKICRTLSLVELFCEYVNELTKLNSQKWMCNKRLIAFRRILNDKEDFKSLFTRDGSDIYSFIFWVNKKKPMLFP